MAMEYLDIDLSLSADDLTVKEVAHQFAETVMRPISKELDAMDPEQAIAEGSPLYTFLKKAYELDLHMGDFPEQFGGPGLSPLQAQIADEELGWGSIGLCILLGAAGMPARAALMSGNPELIEEFVVPFCSCKDGSIRGCWAVNDPDHGSDNLGFGEDFFTKVRSTTRAKKDGDHWIISGQKAAWVSGAATATHALTWVELDPTKGLAGQGAAIVPLDLPGCSKGKALDKVGMRDLNQTELYFDDVRIPKRYMVIDNPDKYEMLGTQFLVAANMMMGIESTGLARAAFEEAFAYCKERVQGGRPLIEHYAMKQRLFAMFARVETCRAIARRVCSMNMNLYPGFAEYAMVAKTTATELAFKNAHEAVQIFGGNGLTKEYLIEKLFRDARSGLIADGNTEALQRYGGQLLMESYPRTRNSMLAVLRNE
jgi:alkylation response protein AidB-like acyl-CoA dehydrogenase